MNEREKKHAYLIMAHNDLGMLKHLLTALDDERADIYLHLDKKWKGVSINQLTNICKESDLIILPRQKVTWGGYSVVNCELNLLKESTKNYSYQYYHLLSGVDFPLKTQDEINQFFDLHDGMEYFDYIASGDSPVANGRVKEYHFFQDIIGRNDNAELFMRLLGRLEKMSLSIQKRIKINRIRKIEFQIYKGAEWFSITDRLAKFVLSNEKKIKKCFRWSICPDELFLQTIAMQSEFTEKFAFKNMREIDWKRGSPYVYTDEDYNSLVSSTNLFARKFSYVESPNLVDHLLERLLIENNQPI